MTIKQAGIVFIMLITAISCQTNKEKENTQESEENQIEESTPGDTLQGAFDLSEYEEVQDTELKQFVEIAMQLQDINMEAQQDMISLAEGGELGLDRFDEIFRSQQDPGMEQNATEEELALYEETLAGFQEIQEEAQGIMEQLIVESGMTLQRYEEIITIIQSNPAMQAKFMEITQGME